MQDDSVSTTYAARSREWIYDFQYITACEFEMGGPEGIIESAMVEKESKALQTEAVDCRWFIQAPPGSKVILTDL